MKTHLISLCLWLTAGVASGQHTLTVHKIPDFAEFPTISSEIDGCWMNEDTWGGGRVPGPSDIVLVSHHVTVCGNCNANVRTIGVKGELTVEGPLAVKDILVYPSGKLTLGPGCRVTIRDLPCDHATDPEEYGTGLVCLGRITASGVNKPAYLRAAGDVSGERITLVAPSDTWLVGDELVIPGTDQTDIRTSERRRITAIAGPVLTLDSPLTFEHPAARDAASQIVQTPPIINLTRSIVIRSENPDGTRAHVLFSERADVRLTGVQFSDVSRTKMTGFGAVQYNVDGTVKVFPTSQTGRYGPHWHHCFGPAQTDSPYQFEMSGCTIDLGDKERDLRWGSSVHQSHYGLIANNVFWGRAQGGNFVTEDGNEIENHIENNILGGTREGYWFYGYANYFNGNVAVECHFDIEAAGSNDGQGFAIGWPNRIDGRTDPPKTVLIPTARGQDKSHWVSAPYRGQRLLEFVGNEAIGCDTGVAVWAASTRLGRFGVPSAPEELLVSNQIAWHCRIGILSYYEQYATYDGLRCYGDPRWSLRNTNSKFPNGFGSETLGFFAGARSTHHATLRDAVIHNCGIGVHVRISGNIARELLIDSCELRNVTNIYRGLYCQQPLGVRTLVKDCLFGLPAPVPQKNVVTSDITCLATRCYLYEAPDEFRVENFNRVTGDSFDLYFPQQSPSFVLTSKFMAPAAYLGLTVQQVYDRFGQQLAGKIAPCTSTRPRITGFICEEIP